MDQLRTGSVGEYLTFTWERWRELPCWHKRKDRSIKGHSTRCICRMEFLPVYMNFMHVGKLALVLDTSKGPIFDGQGQAEKEDGEYEEQERSSNKKKNL